MNPERPLDMNDLSIAMKEWAYAKGKLEESTAEVDRLNKQLESASSNYNLLKHRFDDLTSKVDHIVKNLHK